MARPMLTLVAMADNALKAAGLRAIVGPTWTTDAPFRETAEAIEAAKRRGILAVEMEAAALYTFAQARQAKRPVYRSCDQHHGADCPGF